MLHLLFSQHINTVPWMDETHFAPPKKSWTDSIPLLPANVVVSWFQSGAKRISQPSTVGTFRLQSLGSDMDSLAHTKRERIAMVGGGGAVSGSAGTSSEFLTEAPPNIESHNSLIPSGRGRGQKLWQSKGVFSLR